MQRSDLEPFTEKLFSRSSGAGGQNVNKVNTRVQLHFQIALSGLSEYHKSRLFQKYPDGVVRVECQETRSQARNIDIAFEQLERKINQSFVVHKKRTSKRAPHLTKGGKIRKVLKDKLAKYRKRYLEKA